MFNKTRDCLLRRQKVYILYEAIHQLDEYTRSIKLTEIGDVDFLEEGICHRKLKQEDLSLAHIEQSLVCSWE